MMGIVADSLRRAVRGAEGGDRAFTVTLESPQNPDKWIQLRGDEINVAFPFHADPATELTRRGFAFPEYVEVLAWEAGKFATFEHRAEPFAELVAFVERYSREILGVEPNESAFAISVEE